jgi:hypothetical protein
VALIESVYDPVLRSLENHPEDAVDEKFLPDRLFIVFIQKY